MVHYKFTLESDNIIFAVERRGTLSVLREFLRIETIRFFRKQCRLALRENRWCERAPLSTPDNTARLCEPFFLCCREFRREASCRQNSQLALRP